HLDTLGIPRDRITLLSPGTDTRRVPTEEGERPGTGAAIGGVVGAATGAAVGFPLGAAITMMIPGIGPIIASGIIGALLFGAGAAAFNRDEILFRRGFEAALSPAFRGKSWDEALPELRARHRDEVDAPAFRHGWERGQDYQREQGFGTGLRKIA